jgi:hypothetical protein
MRGYTSCADRVVLGVPPLNGAVGIPSGGNYTIRSERDGGDRIVAVVARIFRK